MAIAGKIRLIDSQTYKKDVTVSMLIVKLSKTKNKGLFVYLFYYIAFCKAFVCL
jgi:hypothetical protein